MKDDDIIIIRHKLSEPIAPAMSAKLKVWHALVAVAVVAFVLGAVIF